MVAAGIGYITDCMVLSLSEDRVLTVVSPSTGYATYLAEAVIIATGCRERTRGALNIPGTRPAGVFTAGTIQQYVNIYGYMPGKKIVVLGSGDIGLIMARRLTLEGAEVLRVCEVMPYPGGLARNIAQCLDDFNIPLFLSHTVTEIRGRERVEGVVISEVDENRKPIPGTEELVECDTLLLSVGLIPENELARGADIAIDPVTGGAVVDQTLQTSVDGVFACGNALHVHDLVDYVSQEAERAGRSAAEYVSENREKLRCDDCKKTLCRVIPGDGVRYVVPQTVRRDIHSKAKFFFRVRDIYRNATVSVIASDRVLYEKKKSVVTPGEMECIDFSDDIMSVAQNCDNIEIKVKSNTL